eukprot:scaffold150380_cov28-Tisochrysis_lutea.AAC.1
MGVETRPRNRRRRRRSLGSQSCITPSAVPLCTKSTSASPSSAIVAAFEANTCWLRVMVRFTPSIRTAIRESTLWSRSRGQRSDSDSARSRRCSSACSLASCRGVSSGRRGAPRCPAAAAER